MHAIEFAGSDFIAEVSEEAFLDFIRACEGLQRSRLAPRVEEENAAQRVVIELRDLIAEVEINGLQACGLQGRP